MPDPNDQKSDKTPGATPAEHPYITAGLWSRWFYCWVFPLLWYGSRKELQAEDVSAITPDNAAKTLSDKLTLRWSQELKRSDGKPSLNRALISIFRSSFMSTLVILLVKDCIFRVVQGPALGYLLAYFVGSVSKEYGYAAGVCLIVCSFVYTIIHHQSSFKMIELGMRPRIATTVLVYQKALRLSQYSVGMSSIGQMTNLMSNDVNRFDRSSAFLPYLIVAPIQAIVITAVLWLYLGPSCLALTLSLIFLAPVQGFVGKIFGKYRLKSAIETDKRVRLINEVVNGIQLIKMSTWEKPYAALVSVARKAELKYIRQRWRLDALNQALFDVASKIIIVITLLTYILVGNQITAVNVFVTLTLSNYLRLTITTFLPTAITAYYELRVSVQRIQNFLMLDERPQSVNPGKDLLGNSNDPKLTPGISVYNFSSTWNPKTNELCLNKLNIDVEPGKLIAVIGPVGSGKSSLLQAILGELPPLSGKVSVTGSLAYASQDPWLFSGTVKQNILFGLDYDAKWYNEVIETCALSRDLTLLPHGDQTLVGDKGMVLSGGQKARINLARAIYANADVYLLDDPLSAVDAKVGRHLFENCIRGTLSSKVVILVTHQLQFCDKADEVIILKKGEIEARGVYEDLKSGDWGLETHEDTKFDIDHIEGPDITEGGLNKKSIDNASKSSENRKEEKESQAAGTIRYALHWIYFRSGNGYFSLILFVFLNIFAQVLLTGSDYWLKIWTQDEARFIHNSTEIFKEPVYLIQNSSVISNLDAGRSDSDRFFDVGVYGLLVLTLFLFALARNQFLIKVCMSASAALHDSLFSAVLRAPMRFFEVNSAGRVNNRLVNDVGNIDDVLPRLYNATLNHLFQAIGAVTIVSIIQPMMILPSVLQFLLFIYIRNFSMRTSSTLKRLESLARSPVFSHLSTSLHGLTTIRAFKAERTLEAQFVAFQDTHTASLYFHYAAMRWLAVVLDHIANVYVAGVVLSYLFSAAGSSTVGLAISSALNLTLICSYGISQSAEVDNQLISVERVREYSKIKPEGEFESKDNKPDESWATFGKLEFKNVVVQYGSDPPVLHGVSFVINPKEKIGIVGRTGAGKSTIISTIFRLVQPSSGSVHIDDLDISTLGLHDVRSKITIIPQNPILFVGTIRKNLDAFDKHDDAELWRVLEEVNLVDRVKQISAAGLDSEVVQGGSNFSSGERQLLCLARAILSQSKILVLDEATANVDAKTDALIQKTITDKFKDCTILTVAHRLDTVMKSHRICVLEAGRVVEFDEPHILLNNPVGGLSQLVQQTGKHGQSQLAQMALQAHEERQKKLHFD